MILFEEQKFAMYMEGLTLPESIVVMRYCKEMADLWDSQLIDEELDGTSSEETIFETEKWRDAAETAEACTEDKFDGMFVVDTDSQYAGKGIAAVLSIDELGSIKNGE